MPVLGGSGVEPAAERGSEFEVSVGVTVLSIARHSVHTRAPGSAWIGQLRMEVRRRSLLKWWYSVEICLPSEVVMSERENTCRNSRTALIRLRLIPL